MSAIRSPNAAALVAAAIVDVATDSPAERRLYLGRHLGIDPADVLEALLEGGTREPLTLDGSVQLETVAAGAATLIPYLVVDAADAGRNRGSQGFAAWLRTEFTTGATPGRAGFFSSSIRMPSRRSGRLLMTLRSLAGLHGRASAAMRRLMPVTSRQRRSPAPSQRISPADVETSSCWKCSLRTAPPMRTTPQRRGSISTSSGTTSATLAPELTPVVSRAG